MIFLEILFVLYVLVQSWFRPSVVFAILMQMNIIRSIFSLDLNEVCFTCQEDPDILYGGLLPVISLLIIVVKTSIRGKIRYSLSLTGVYFLISLSVFFIGSFYSPDFMGSIQYFFKYLVLGLSFFFVAKLYFSNSNNISSEIEVFLNTILIIAIVSGVISLLALNNFGGVFQRLTVPGAHPIVYSQLMGLASLILLTRIFNKGSKRGIKRQMLRAVLFLFCSALLIMSKTRGVLLAAVLSVLIYVGFNLKHVSKKWIYIVTSVFITGGIYLNYRLDLTKIFGRIINASDDESISQRMKLYKDGFSLLFSKPLGAGTDGFKFYTVEAYAHNFFLENLAFFGVPGIILNFFFLLLLVYISLKIWNYRRINPYFVLVYMLVVFFFMETMFSFTMWMHKGLYFSLALISVLTINQQKRVQV